jgi:hypothetical protein
MHFIKNLEHPSVKISLYLWNNRYILKFEQNFLEQTYKIDVSEVSSQSDLENMIDAKFVEKVLGRFRDMSEDWFLKFD